LAVAAETTQRHVSFVESGRATASREMILRLAATLNLPLRQQNALLLAAGYAPAWRERDLSAPELASKGLQIPWTDDFDDPRRDSAHAIVHGEQRAAQNVRERHVLSVVSLRPAETVGDPPRFSPQALRLPSRDRRRQ